MAAKRILTFIVAEVKPVVEAVRTATESRVTYGQLYDRSLHKEGKIKKDANGFPDADNIDLAKVPKAVWLVKDHGCYLMPGTKLPEGAERAQVAYAVECNPQRLSFDEWWDNCTRIMGGDDSVEALPLDWFEKAVASPEGDLPVANHQPQHPSGPVGGDHGQAERL